MARQAVSALLLQWAEQDAIYGDPSGALGKGKGTKPGGKGPKQQPTERSAACLWLDAQHDARSGMAFLQSITGNVGGAIRGRTKWIPRVLAEPWFQCANERTISLSVVYRHLGRVSIVYLGVLAPCGFKHVKRVENERLFWSNLEDWISGIFVQPLLRPRSPCFVFVRPYVINRCPN